MKRIFCIMLAAVCLIGCCSTGVFAAEGSLNNFKKVNTYTDDCFTDVAVDAWYRGYVATAYELGLVKGNADGSYNPDGAVTVAETIVIACRIHSIYYHGTADVGGNGGPWYMPYINYAITNGILDSAIAISDYNAAASRSLFAGILAHSLPSSALPAVNSIEDNSIPDVKSSDAFAKEIYSLYRAGILRGSNERGRYSPNDLIARREVATIITRMAYRSLREKFTLAGYTGPDLKAQPLAGDSFFSDAAILGNSLVEGLRLYSKLPMDYYSGTSMTVNSAMYTKSVTLKNGAAGTQLDAMAQKSYGKVYIQLGINEIGGDVGIFIDMYGTMIDRIRSAQPYADIYIMAITPVSRSKSSSSSVFNMDRINMYNAALHQLAADKQCYYLDDCTPLLGPDGYLPEGDTWDGVHFSVEKYSQWEEVIRTYYS